MSYRNSDELIVSLAAGCIVFGFLAIVLCIPIAGHYFAGIPGLTFGLVLSFALFIAASLIIGKMDGFVW